MPESSHNSTRGTGVQLPCAYHAKPDPKLRRQKGYQPEAYLAGRERARETYQASLRGQTLRSIPLFSEKRTSQVLGATQGARAQEHGSAEALFTLLAKGTAPAPAKNFRTLWRRGTTPKGGGHGPSATPLAWALCFATGLRLSFFRLVLLHGDSVAVTAAVPAIHCTAAITEPVLLVFAFASPEPPADAAGKGMDTVRLEWDATHVLTGHDWGRPSAKPACDPGTASGDWSGVRLWRRLSTGGGGGGVRPPDCSFSRWGPRAWLAPSRKGPTWAPRTLGLCFHPPKGTSLGTLAPLAGPSRGSKPSSTATKG